MRKGGGRSEIGSCAATRAPCAAARALPLGSHPIIFRLRGVDVARVGARIASLECNTSTGYSLPLLIVVAQFARPHGGAGAPGPSSTPRQAPTRLRRSLTPCAACRRLDSGRPDCCKRTRAHTHAARLPPGTTHGAESARESHQALTPWVACRGCRCCCRCCRPSRLATLLETHAHRIE